MSNLKPSLYLRSVADLNPDILKTLCPDIEGAMFDLDRTVVGHHDKFITAGHLAMFISLSEAGLELGFISNAGQKRANRVQQMADAVSDATGNNTHVVTSHMVNGMRKPLQDPFEKMTEVSGIPRDKLCYVGDQIMKDVLGANRAGYAGSILVAPYGTGDNLAVRLIQRPIEAAIRPLLGMPLLTRDF
jgi:HAD superfamily phosphatase (TIGR01668 family)